VSEQRTTAATAWPRLRVADWTDTRETVHLWTQIVGKIRMAHTPMLNHWWHVTLYVTARGLSTSAIPYRDGVFELEFDFLDHQMVLRADDGRHRRITLRPKPVAQFYAETLDALRELGIDTQIHGRPNEVDVAIPFAEDTRHASYDAAAATLFWRQLLQADRVLGAFRSRFVGKSSPVHYFWGGMDLACTRFSGRPAPPHPGGYPNCPAWVMREGYSHELASFGFWPGGGEEGGFYAYAYPEPDDFPGARVRPGAAHYIPAGEFLLPYETVAAAADPDRTLTEFLESTYVAAADLGGWDRAALEADPVRWRALPPGTHG